MASAASVTALEAARIWPTLYFSSAADADAIAADRSVLDATLRARLRQVPRDQIAALGRYARLAEQAQQDSDHPISPDTQRYRTSVTIPTMGSLASAYGQLRVADDQAAPVAASLLATLIELQNRDAAAQGSPNAAERKYRSLQLSDALIQKTLAAVEAEAPVPREYQQLLAENVSHRPTAPPRMSLDQARQLILDSFQSLGADYTSRFAALLDPANGRLDLTGGKPPRPHGLLNRRLRHQRRRPRAAGPSSDRPHLSRLDCALRKFTRRDRGLAPVDAAHYQALLRRGFAADTDALLASMNIRLGDPNLVKAASRLMRAKIAELRDLYR